MKRLLLLITAIVSIGIAQAQDSTAFKAILCRFEVPRAESGSEYGAGFIIARQGDTLFLVTAGHVLRDRIPDRPVPVLLGESKDTLKAEVVLCHDPKVDQREDLAICRVIAPRVFVPKIPFAQLPTRVPVFYYHKTDLKIETGGGEQELITLNLSQHAYQIYLPELPPGDSGGPVFTLRPIPQLIGMILRGDAACDVLQISHILTIIQQEMPMLMGKLMLSNEKIPYPAAVAAH